MELRPRANDFLVLFGPDRAGFRCRGYESRGFGTRSWSADGRATDLKKTLVFAQLKLLLVHCGLPCTLCLAFRGWLAAVLPPEVTAF